MWMLVALEEDYRFINNQKFPVDTFYHPVVICEMFTDLVNWATDNIARNDLVWNNYDLTRTYTKYDFDIGENTVINEQFRAVPVNFGKRIDCDWNV